MKIFMHKNHERTIQRIIDNFYPDDNVTAVLVGGSIAHGFALENSDVDIMIVVNENEYNKREKEGALHYYNTELCDYESGYVDGKFITLKFMEQVAACGSEPARFAFDSAIVAFSKNGNLDALIKQIACYPVEKKDENIKKFYSQLQAWNWFCYEALKKDNKYLLNTAVSNLILFGGRMVLAHNELLYPYHKWFLRVLENAEKKPSGLINKIDKLLAEPDQSNIEDFYNTICSFHDWNVEGVSWAHHFIEDTELTWLNGKMNIADI